MITNLDLLTVGIAVAATVVLGFTVYLSDRKSITTKTFLYFTLVTAGWGIVNYLSYQFTGGIVIWLLRFVLFFALLQAFFLYRLFSVFPSKEYIFSKRHRLFFGPLIFFIALLTLSPYVFSNITGYTKATGVALVDKGIGLPIFALVAGGLVIRAFYILTKKMRQQEDLAEKMTLKIILIGAVIMFSLIIFFNLIIATVFNNPRFIPFGALFTFPFILFVSYAILKQKLFNIKVISIAISIFVLSVVLFFEIIFAETLVMIIFRSGIFFLVLVFGVNLIRSVLREVEQREHIQKLAEELQAANDGQLNLIHIINHQIKGYLSKARNIFSEFITNPIFNDLVTGSARKYSEQGFEILTEGAHFVQGVLNASSIENGMLQYTMELFDLKELVIQINKQQKDVANKKGLQYQEEIAKGEYIVKGDNGQLREAFRNMIDNAIRYTPTGSVVVSLYRQGQTIVFSVKDTGIGITEDDKKRLFVSGGKGKNSSKINVDSTGYGLSFVKGVVSAHTGTVRVFSEGEGKGSVFTVLLPSAK